MRFGQENLVLLYTLLLVPMVISAMAVDPVSRPPILTEKPEVKTVHQGDNVTFKCHTMRDPLTKIQWIRHLVINGSQVDTHGKPNMEIIKLTKPNVSDPEKYTITNVSATDAGKYTCYAVNVSDSVHRNFELKVILRGQSKSGFKVKNVHPFNTEIKYSYYIKKDDKTQGSSSSGSYSGLSIGLGFVVFLIKIALAAWCCYVCCRKRKKVVVVQQQAPANGNSDQHPQQQPFSIQVQPPSYEHVVSAGHPPEYGQHHRHAPTTTNKSTRRKHDQHDRHAPTTTKQSSRRKYDQYDRHAPKTTKQSSRRKYDQHDKHAPTTTDKYPRRESDQHNRHALRTTDQYPRRQYDQHDRNAWTTTNQYPRRESDQHNKHGLFRSAKVNEEVKDTPSLWY